MKKALLVALMLVVFGAVAWASPFYFEYNQDILSGEPAGNWQAGLTFSFSQTTELDCPREHPCGGYYQFSTISFCGDLFIGNGTVWTYPGEYYAGFEGNLRWNYLNLGLDTKITFEPIGSGWPWASPVVDSWITDLVLGLRFVNWASGRVGVNLDYDYVEGFFKMTPSFGFRLGNQSGCECW